MLSLVLCIFSYFLGDLIDNGEKDAFASVCVCVHKCLVIHHVGVFRICREMPRKLVIKYTELIPVRDQSLKHKSK